MSENLGERVLTGVEIHEHLRTRVEHWDFSSSNPVRHTVFTHNVAHAVLDSFMIDENYTLYPDHDKDMPGELIPEPLQELLISSFRNELHYGSGSEITLRQRRQHLPAAVSIRGMDDLRDATLAELQRKASAIVQADPTSLIISPQVKDETIIMEYRPSYASYWGLALELAPTGVTPAVFGEAGSTREATAFVARHFGEQQIWAYITSHLAILSAEYAAREFTEPIKPIPRNYLDGLLARRLSDIRD